MEYKPHDYQKSAHKFVLSKPNSLIAIGLGMGKSVISLTVVELLINSLEVEKVLIISPKLCTEQSWPAEIAKWDHTKNLKVSIIAGDQKTRIRAYNTPADIYLVSRDNIAWLVRHCLAQRKKVWPFQMLVVDESSSFKNPQAVRFKALRKVAPQCERVILLSATPAAKDLLDLWPQMYLLDKGERLGRTLTEYRDRYFTANYNGFGYTLREGADILIKDKIKDLCLSLSARDYLTMPDRIDVVREVDLENKAAYDKFKKDEVLELVNGEDITPLTAAALYSKLTQYTGGSVYSEDKNYHVVDNAKLEAMLEDYEALNGESVIIFYQFKSELERIKAKIPEAVIPKTAADIDAWNRGEVKCLLAHAASIGHGLNLAQGGRNIFWYGYPWSLELYLQAVGRLDRQGQTKPVINRGFVAKGTVDEVIAARLKERAINQQQLLDALKKHLL